MSVERSRKHGPFDLRYPPMRHKPAPASLWRLGEERSDWQGFLTRFFPGCRRHDFDTLAAYQAYRNDVSGRYAVHSARSHNAQRGKDEDEPPAAAETERWEGEGGTTTAAGQRTRRVERPVPTQMV